MISDDLNRKDHFPFPILRGVWIILAFMSLGLFPASGQDRHPLGKDVSGFTLSLQDYMLADPNLEKDEREFLEVQIPGYLSRYALYPVEVQEEVAEIARLTYKARLKAYPDLFRFLELHDYIQQDFPHIEEEWLSACRQLLKRNKARLFKTLVEKTSGLVHEGNLYQSNAAHWKVSSTTNLLFRNDDQPVFIFKDIILSCYAYGDSTSVYHTSGEYFPLDDRFEGVDGKVDWRRVGLSPDTCWADLVHYRVNLRQARLEAPQAEFHNGYLFDRELSGSFVDRIVSARGAVADNYPSFVSGEESLMIPDYREGIDVAGPFVQQGSRTRLGLENKPALLYVRHGDTLLGKLESPYLILDKGEVSSSEGRLVIYLKEDSLYNPAVSLRFDPQHRVFHIGQAKDYGFRVPFIDTYHQIRMDFESMRWYPDRSLLEIGLLNIPGRVGVVEFKSLHLYSRDELGQMMLGMEQNPLYLLGSLAKKKKSTSYHLDDLAAYINMSQVQALALLKMPIAYGYVSYDPENKMVSLLPQLFHNLDVTAGKADFDELEFVTTEEGIVKAVMRLDSLDIRMTGVPMVRLSQKQNVYAMPSDSVVYIFKNRDFHFNGLLHAGTFNFTVRGACFYYDDFKVDIADVEELGLAVRREKDGEQIMQEVETVIRSMAGSLYIDHPKNKGGRLDYPQYPIFESTQPSYAYFDAPHIRNGVYTADSFYFQVDPFQMEKLNTLNPDSIRFVGTLMSGGIFPDFREALVVRPDYSLGFETRSPDSGWPAYQGQANYIGTVSLDKAGLYGDGTFDYLSSHSESSLMVFEPSRMISRLDRFSLRDSTLATVSFPPVSGQGVDAVFYRNPVLFEVSSVKDSLLDVFDEQWTLAGTYSFSPGNSWARGTFRQSDHAAVSSSLFAVRTRGFSSDSAHFRLMANAQTDFLSSGSYQTDIDLDTRQGDFLVKGANVPVEFGLHQYEGRSSGMRWDMDKRNVFFQSRGVKDDIYMAALDTMGAGELFDAPLPGEDFVSTRRAQAGLHFHATSGVLDCADSSLHFNGVKRLLVSDALFVPDQEYLKVRSGGMLAPLAQAELYFGDRSRLHRFHHVKAEITSARQYRASGLYDYTAPDMESQPIYFEGIRPMGQEDAGTGQRNYVSQATARIQYDSSLLYLNDGFQFIGKILVRADQTYPYFSGSTRMVYSCDFSDSPSQVEEAPFATTDGTELSYDAPYYDAPYKEEGNSSYDDFEYSSEDGSDVSSENQDMDKEAISETDAEEYLVEDEEERPVSRRGRKKEDPDEALPSAEAAHLAKGNPFLVDGIQFEASINSDSVLIPVNNRTRSTVGRLLGCGFYTTARSRDLKFLFLRQRISTDLPNLAYEGFLFFSKKDKAYQVFDSTGKDVVEVRVGSCFARATGEADLGMKTYELGIGMYGDMTLDSRQGVISSQGITRFDFFLIPDIAKDIAVILNSNTQLPAADISQCRHLQDYILKNEGERTWKRVQDEINLTGVMDKIPPCLQQTLVFSDLRLDWNPQRKAYVYSGEAELLSVAGNAVNKKLKAYVVLRKNRKGDIVDIYLEGASYSWIYFSYTNHYMQIISSDEAFNDKVTQLKPKARRKDRFEFFLSTLSKRNIFVRSFQEMDGFENQY